MLLFPEIQFGDTVLTQPVVLLPAGKPVAPAGAALIALQILIGGFPELATTVLTPPEWLGRYDLRTVHADEFRP